jgi:catechol 2,3-dioxygenase-like lactoylglutathione lyase family enzyme
MTQGVQVASLYVHDQDEALQFYVEKLGFRIHTDARNGDYRWLTVQHPDQPEFQLGLFRPEARSMMPRRGRYWKRLLRERCHRSF